MKNIFPHFFFPQKETWRKEKLAPDEDTVAKTAFFAKIPAALCLLTKLAENFLTLITCFSPTYFIWCRRNTRCKHKIQKFQNQKSKIYFKASPSKFQTLALVILTFTIFPSKSFSLVAILTFFSVLVLPK